MSFFWSNITREIKPYIPGEQPKSKKYIKLNTNENPYPPSPNVIEAIKKATNDDLRLYPDPACDDLKSAIAQYYKLKTDQVFVGNGSDEVLAFSFLAFFNPGKPVLFPDITYSFYKVYTTLFSLDYELIPLDEKFNVPVEKFFRENAGIIIPNPNAPIGKLIPVESIERILHHNRNSVVIIDEAYIDFGGESAVKLIGDYPNLLVIQTFSKSRSLAGLRVGFCLGQEKLIEGLRRIKNSINSYTLDRLAMAGAIAAIKDESHFQKSISKIVNTRNRVTISLQEMGFQIPPSKTNFIFISHPVYSASFLFHQLKEKDILVRYFSEPRIDNFLRVSIGSDEEMNFFLAAMGKILSQNSTESV